MKLISFKTCPFVQRAVIMLLEKKIPFQIEYIDLDQKPSWFLDISPRGKVPVLLVDNTPLFESQAICEFLEEAAPEPALMPEDLIGRARDRAWFAFASEELFGPMYRLQYAKNEEQFAERSLQVRQSLAKLDQELGTRSFLSAPGERFGLADVAIAPALFRLKKWQSRGWMNLLAEFPGLQGLQERILGRPSLQRSVPEDFDAEDLASMQRQGAFLVRTSL